MTKNKNPFKGTVKTFLITVKEVVRKTSFNDKPT